MSDTWWTNPTDLDDEQKAVITLPKDGHNLVIGPTGCGKTNLLLLRASFLYKSGLKNIAVLTFARSLREFLASGADNYSFSPDKIQTYISWGNSVLAENSLPKTQGDDFAAVRSTLLEHLKSIAKNTKPHDMFDSILLDEAIVHDSLLHFSFWAPIYPNLGCFLWLVEDVCSEYVEACSEP